MKKLYGFILFLCMLAVFGVSVSAATYSVSGHRETIAGYDEAYEIIYNAANSREESADISHLGISAADVGKIFGDILISVPEFFYLDNSFSYYYHSSSLGKTVTKVNLRYTMTAEETEAAKKTYEQELSYIVSLVDDDMTETEKALFVHDYIISSFEYDESLTYFDVYSLFVNRRGVCQAYSLAYMAVLRELGMEAVMVTSDEMNHAWNMVKVDGEWYHCDLSYDDPAPDRPGHVMHTNFLLSDESIAATTDPHFGWSSVIRCDAPDPEGIFRGKIDSAMAYYDGEWYYIDSGTGTLAVSDFSGKYRTDLYTFDRWFVKGRTGTYWVGYFSGVSAFLNHIFVNTPTEVLICSPASGRIDVYLEAEEGERFFGSWIYKNRLEYLVSDTPVPDENAEVKIFEITDFSIEDAGKPLPFEDVTRIDNYYGAVKDVYERGLFNGVSSTKFAPDAALTRAMYVTVLGRLCKVDTAMYGSSGFRDVDDGMWYTPYVQWASEMGLVNGIGDDRFDPMGEITREQMIKITAGLGIRLRAGNIMNVGTIVLIEDRNLISDWAAEGVAYCVENGLIANTGCLEPQKNATRAEAAGIVSALAGLSGV